MLNETYLSLVMNVLRMQGASIGPGLSDEEVECIEEKYALSFPPDLRVLLQTGVPVGRGFPKWRGAETAIRERLEWPSDGICFDVEHNNVWRAAWGDRPIELSEALEVARANIRTAPILVPIYGHRYIPSEPHEMGNPVFSVHQTDIIYYGFDLASYLGKEFGVPVPSWAATRAKPIRWWGYYVEEEYAD